MPPLPSTHQPRSIRRSGGPRRRGLWAASVLALMVGCGGGPEAAVRSLEEAAREGDAERAMKLLGPATRARLETDARRAAEQAGRRAIAPSTLLAAGWTAARYELSEVRTVARGADRAVVETGGRRGERERIELVREGGAWKVELP